MVAGPDDRDPVRVPVEVTLGEPFVAVVSSEEGVDAVVADVGVAVSDWTLADVDSAGVEVAAWSLSETCGPERTFVDAPSLKTATARHTTKLVTAVARTHDAAATAAIRRRDRFSTRPSLCIPKKGPVKEPRNIRPSEPRYAPSDSEMP